MTRIDTTFGFAGGGFAVLMGSEPARRLDDLRGQKIWVPEGDQISLVAMEAMNLATPFPPIPENLKKLAGEPMVIKFSVSNGPGESP